MNANCWPRCLQFLETAERIYERVLHEPGRPAFSRSPRYRLRQLGSAGGEEAGQSENHASWFSSAHLDCVTVQDSKSLLLPTVSVWDQRHQLQRKSCFVFV